MMRFVSNLNLTRHCNENNGVKPHYDLQTALLCKTNE